MPTSLRLADVSEEHREDHDQHQIVKNRRGHTSPVQFDSSIYMPRLRTAPVAIQRPRAPLGLKIRMRNKGLPQPVGTVPTLPLNRAFPCASNVVAPVLWTDWPAAPGLQTRVPSTCAMGPGVPLKLVPLMTSPST